MKTFKQWWGEQDTRWQNKIAKSDAEKIWEAAIQAVVDHNLKALEDVK